MHFDRPSYKKERVTGFVEGYNFKTIETMGLTLETNAGGWENLEASKADRVLIVKRGLGFARMQGKTYRLEEDVVLEVPQGVLVEMNGMFSYFCVSSKNA